MKKLLLFAFAACALAACSDDDGDSRVPATAVVLDYFGKRMTKKAKNSRFELLF